MLKYFILSQINIQRHYDLKSDSSGGQYLFFCVCVKVLRSKTAYDIKICFQIKRSWILIILFIIILLFLNYSGKPIYVICELKLVGS